MFLSLKDLLTVFLVVLVAPSRLKQLISPSLRPAARLFFLAGISPGAGGNATFGQPPRSATSAHLEGSPPPPRPPRVIKFVMGVSALKRESGKSGLLLAPTPPLHVAFQRLLAWFPAGPLHQRRASPLRASPPRASPPPLLHLKPDDAAFGLFFKNVCICLFRNSPI